MMGVRVSELIIKRKITTPFYLSLNIKTRKYGVINPEKKIKGIIVLLISLGLGPDTTSGLSNETAQLPPKT